MWPIVRLDDNRKVAFRNPYPGGPIAINPHRAQVHYVGVMTARIDNSAEQVVGPVEVIAHCVAHFVRTLHRIGGPPAAPQNGRSPSVSHFSGVRLARDNQSPMSDWESVSSCRIYSPTPPVALAASEWASGIRSPVRLRSCAERDYRQWPRHIQATPRD